MQENLRELCSLAKKPQGDQLNFVWAVAMIAEYDNTTDALIEFLKNHPNVTQDEVFKHLSSIGRSRYIPFIENGKVTKVKLRSPVVRAKNIQMFLASGITDSKAIIDELLNDCANNPTAFECVHANYEDLLSDDPFYAYMFSLIVRFELFTDC